MTPGLLVRWWLFYGLTVTLLIYGISQIGHPPKINQAKPSKELQTCRIN